MEGMKKAAAALDATRAAFDEARKQIENKETRSKDALTLAQSRIDELNKQLDDANATRRTAQSLSVELETKVTELEKRLTATTYANQKEVDQLQNDLAAEKVLAGDLHADKDKLQKDTDAQQAFNVDLRKENDDLRAWAKEMHNANQARIHELDEELAAQGEKVGGLLHDLDALKTVSIADVGPIVQKINRQVEAFKQKEKTAKTPLSSSNTEVRAADDSAQGPARPLSLPKKNTSSVTEDSEKSQSLMSMPNLPEQLCGGDRTQDVRESQDKRSVSTQASRPLAELPSKIAPVLPATLQANKKATETSRRILEEGERALSSLTGPFDQRRRTPEAMAPSLPATQAQSFPVQAPLRAHPQRLRRTVAEGLEAERLRLAHATSQNANTPAVETSGRKRKHGGADEDQDEIKVAGRPKVKLRLRTSKGALSRGAAEAIPEA